MPQSKKSQGHQTWTTTSTRVSSVKVEPVADASQLTVVHFIKNASVAVSVWPAEAYLVHRLGSRMTDDYLE